MNTTDALDLCNACDAERATTPGGYCATCDNHRAIEQLTDSQLLDDVDELYDAMMSEARDDATRARLIKAHTMALAAAKRRGLIEHQ